MEKATLTRPFMSGRSQAVRIPKEYRFDEDDELYINKIGDTLIITPVEALQSTFQKSLTMFSEDFMSSGRPQEASNAHRDRENTLS